MPQARRALDSAVGVDVGATLAKIAYRRDQAAESTRFELLSTHDIEAVVARVRELAPDTIGVTGGGAPRLQALLEQPTVNSSEFDAWGLGASTLIREQRAATDGSVNDEATPAAKEPFLLVSLGTGTSVLLVQDAAATRVGGTALGGGTLVGLAGALTGAGFEELCELAIKGDAANVDLRVSDIYSEAVPLAGDLTAANFGKLAHELARGQTIDMRSLARRADLAAAVTRLVGENVSLICAGLAAATGTQKVVFGGSTVRGNPQLVEVLREITTMCGRTPSFLPHGEFAGALGALEIASAEHVAT